MKRIVEMLFAGVISIVLIGEAEAKELLSQIIKESPSKIVCEIKPRDGSSKSYAVFYLMAFSAEGNLRYRGFTANQVEIQMTTDGKMLSDKTPCLSEPVAFH